MLMIFGVKKHITRINGGHEILTLNDGRGIYLLGSVETAIITIRTDPEMS